MNLLRDDRHLRTIAAIVALAVASATTGAAKARVAARPADRRNPPIAGAEQMRRQAQAVQAFRNGRVAQVCAR